MGSASGPASPVLTWFGRRVGSLGPGLTSESADAVSGCPAKRSVGRVPGFLAPTGIAGLICLAWIRGRGFTGSTASGCVPSLNHRKEMAMTIVETRAITGGVDTHADTHVAAALDPIGGLLGVAGVPGHPGRLYRSAGLAGRVRDGVPGRDRGDRQLRRRPGPPHHRGWRPGRRGGPLRPAGPSPSGQVRPPRRGQRRPGGAVRPGPRRAQRPRRRGGGDPRADGRQAQRPLRADPDDQPGPGPDPDRPRGPAGPVRPAHRGCLVAELAALRPRPGDVVGYATRIALRELGRRAAVPRRPARPPRRAHRAPGHRRTPRACSPCTASAPTPPRCC